MPRHGHRHIGDEIPYTGHDITPLLSEPATSIIRIIIEKVDTALVYTIILSHYIIYTYVRRTLILSYTASLGVDDVTYAG